eukprot:jgi/Mesvir1/18025/Mv26535-RA.1
MGASLKHPSGVKTVLDNALLFKRTFASRSLLPRCTGCLLYPSLTVWCHASRYCNMNTWPALSRTLLSWSGLIQREKRHSKSCLPWHVRSRPCG